MTEWIGPTRVACPESCEVPAGARLVEVPVPRHAWGDVAVCPNDGCGRAFLIKQRPVPPNGSRT